MKSKDKLLIVHPELPAPPASQDGGMKRLRLFRCRGQQARLTVYHSKDIVVQFIIQGAGSFIIDNKKYYFRRNSVLISAPNKVPCCVPKPRGVFERVVLTFPYEVCMTIFPSEICAGIPPALTIPASDMRQIKSLLQFMEIESNNNKHHTPAIVIRHLQSVLMLVHRNHLRLIHARHHHSVLIGVKKYIEENWHKSLSITTIAQMFHTSERNLTRLFKREIGVGPQRYIMHRQIAESMLLMDQGVTKIIDITERIGMHSIRAYNRNFRIVTGMSPTQYRRLMRIP